MKDEVADVPRKVLKGMFRRDSSTEYNSGVDGSTHRSMVLLKRSLLKHGLVKLVSHLKGKAQRTATVYSAGVGEFEVEAGLGFT